MRTDNSVDHFWSKLLTVVILLILAWAWLLPIMSGFHVGCNVWMDHYHMTRLGVQFCK